MPSAGRLPKMGERGRETERVWEQEKNWIVNFLKASLQTKAENSWSIAACRQHISWPGDSSADTLLEIQLQIQIHSAYRRVNTATGSRKHFAAIVMQGLCPLYPWLSLSLKCNCRYCCHILPGQRLPSSFVSWNIQSKLQGFSCRISYLHENTYECCCSPSLSCAYCCSSPSHWVEKLCMWSVCLSISLSPLYLPS